jgi:hypothetical protein
MKGPGGDAEAGAREIESGNASYNPRYEDGGGKYAPPKRKS